MISISKYKEYTEAIKDEVAGINEVLYVIDQNHVVKKIHDKSDNILVFTYPKAKNQSPVTDNVQENNNCFAFLVTKMNDDKTPDEEIEAYEALQIIMRNIKQWLVDNRVNFESEVGVLDFSSFNTEPEYRIFGGYSGWSIGFNITDYDY